MQASSQYSSLIHVKSTKTSQIRPHRGHNQIKLSSHFQTTSSYEVSSFPQCYNTVGIYYC